MIKRTLYFSNPAYLKTQDKQLHITLTDTGEVRSVPIEDIGLVLLDHQKKHKSRRTWRCVRTKLQQ